MLVIRTSITMLDLDTALVPFVLSARERCVSRPVPMQRIANVLTHMDMCTIPNDTNM